MHDSIHAIAPGSPVVVGSAVVPMPEIGPGDTVIPVTRTGELLVVGADAHAAAAAAVADAHAAFKVLAACTPTQISAFFEGFAARLTDDSVWEGIVEANATDVEDARGRGRHVGRLAVSDKMRAAMVDGLYGWAQAPARVGQVVEERSEATWCVQRVCAPLGVVAFVFEGRPNVLADGVGVLRNGNTAVMRIGGDALGTALALERDALQPALDAAGLPPGAVRLVRSRDHGAGQALFTMPEVRLAVARGSGPTVALLGSIAQQHGTPVSLHGTGGAWIYVDETAKADTAARAVKNSLDRKVCNTLNCLVLDRSGVARIGPALADTLADVGAVVHVVAGSEGVVAGTDVVAEATLATEWEWENAPELTFVVADGLDAAADLINTYSPRFVASIISTRDGAFDEFCAVVDAPYVGDGFTRWVDGQWAWSRPELGLTNWERGRLLGRSGILSGDDIVTVRDLFHDLTGDAPQAR
ncbi:MAG: aldehyde dehydrogenase family protein [Acidimicrobiia bacterium]|nr:aldehyde dehydrogenase family protein [Acidimicrobiia bacterium]